MGTDVLGERNASSLQEEVVAGNGDKEEGEGEQFFTTRQEDAADLGVAEALPYRCAEVGVEEATGSVSSSRSRFLLLLWFPSFPCSSSATPSTSSSSSGRTCDEEGEAAAASSLICSSSRRRLEPFARLSKSSKISLMDRRIFFAILDKGR